MRAGILFSVLNMKVGTRRSSNEENADLGNYWLRSS